MKAKTKISVNCNIRIEEIYRDRVNKDFTLPANQKFSIIVDYPFDTPYIHHFNTGKSGAGFIRIVQEIGTAYTYAYNHKDKYGIWGSNMNNLCLSCFDINLKTRTINLGVGSRG